ncbi:hypothetical protein AB834_04295 [PVC group bacterium (ex Bugula neritina AB1)]|nr:hypothetical protein AB834_04295 [PVC group bacterium (ex Bugula neritina AB1)]
MDNEKHFDYNTIPSGESRSHLFEFLVKIFVILRKSSDHKKYPFFSKTTALFKKFPHKKYSTFLSDFYEFLYFLIHFLRKNHDFSLS